MIKLSEEQQKIIDKDGDVIVQANAGTGKTTVLTEKIKRELNQNRSYMTVAAITFTVKATNEKAGEDVSVEFRKKATEKAGYSKICTVVFKGQAMKPTLGKETTDDITYGTDKKTVNKKEVTYQTITFNKASSMLQIYTS